MGTAGEKLAQEVQGFEDLLCAAHRLELCVTHGLSEEPFDLENLENSRQNTETKAAYQLSNCL